MTSRSKRVLWLLNHTTLMKTEVPILRAMGYEVFIPKVIPKVRFRSASINYSYDEFLTIPEGALWDLNNADLYTENWSSSVVFHMNEYFGTVFIMPIPGPMEQAVTKFQGAILLRAFGLEADRTYAELFPDYHKDLYKWIYAVRDRFWFASGYEQLAEVEPKLLADRDVFLPIAVPSTFEQHKDTWTGEDKQILFVCPDIKTVPYYGNVYDEFKRHFGDLPHVIIGSQKQPVDDPHVIGFVSDEAMMRLMQRSAVMYYHSREPRHLHYTPIEGAEVGMPVILYNDNLAVRMIGRPIAGAVDSVAQARTKILAILNDDSAVIENIREDQGILGKLFSESYCLDVWKRSFIDSAIQSRMEREIPGEQSLQRGCSRKYEYVPYDQLILPSTKQDKTKCFEDGIDFTEAVYPHFITYIDGLSTPESWGSWSNGESVELGVSSPLQGTFSLMITGGVNPENAKKPICIRVGDVVKSFEFDSPPWAPTTASVSFNLFDPVHAISIVVPQPTQVDGVRRESGLGLARIALVRSTID
jgi:glycosyltransferase involved in cell wall biosynthesis